jgi:hypothetical protein
MIHLRRLVLLLAVVAWAVISLPVGGSSSAPPWRTLAISGTPIELAFRALQPGEAVGATLRDDPTVRKVVLRFLDQSWTLAPSAQGGRPFALLGIDLNVKPGPYPMTIRVVRPDGQVESFSSEITVEPREFPSTRLSVAPAMLVPPPEEQERVKREQELVGAVLRVVSPEWLAEGPFISPLADYEPYPNFGQRRIYNNSVASTHVGVDIGAPWGAPAKASNAGRVVLASNLYLSGYTVIIDHGLGVFTYYCHFAKLQVKRGDLVRKGEVIALVGTTGRSTGPHLHWSLRIGPYRVDPFSLVALPIR